MAELKPCPFCGAPYFDLECGTVESPDAFWDGGMGGERYGYVMCYQCNAILKAYSMDEAIEAWNKRADVQVVRHGRWIEEYNVKRFANQVYCSECKKNASFIFISNEHYGISAHGEYKKAPYCPNCGAKMDEEVG